MNDRQLRVIIDGLGGHAHGMPREDGFDITVASEMMAAFCLAEDLEDLKRRCADFLVAYDMDGNPIRAGQLHAQGAMTALLKDALKPNLVQTLEGTPCFIHGGPFANIAHGCNSVIATRMALHFGDYVVTEAGFGADLGAEKFLDIKCRLSGLMPDAVVIVATIKALKYNGGVRKDKLGEENLKALSDGLPNLLKHVENITQVFKLPAVVALNRYVTDTDAEIKLVSDKCRELGVEVKMCEVWEKGGDGGIELAKEVIRLCEEEDSSKFEYAYDLELPLKKKIRLIAQRIYGAEDVDFSPEATKEIHHLEDLGYGNVPICMSKTQYSLTDDEKILGRPRDFWLKVRDVTINAGAGFLVVQTGELMKMPGLPKHPAAVNIDVDENGKITGLF
jgi:formate--tetrahydrofolate ligase